MGMRSSSYRLWIRRLTLYILLPYLLLCVGMAIYQRHFLYIPLPGPTTPQAAGLDGYQAHSLPRADGTAIRYWESDNAQTKPLLFYFHGNSGGLFAFTQTLRYLNHHGFHVVAMEYRGYPGADGAPTQPHLTQDARALYRDMLQHQPTQPAVIWGYSLGSGIATQLAAQEHPAVLILEAPFTATLDRAQEMFPWLPVARILKDQYRSREVIDQVSAPLLILHGDADRVIPLPHGQALYQYASPPKTLKIYPGAGHLDLQSHGAYEDAVAFIRAHLPSAARSPDTAAPKRP